MHNVESRQSPISEALTRLNDSLVGLEDIAATLSRVTSMISKPSEPISEDEPNRCLDSAPSSPLAAELNSCSRRVIEVINNLGRLLNRIEL